ncbi:carboxylate-amine ligase [Microvirga rosea]|uniref:carboxylate-amine ligase n=1 Tax=Microvirga rosea TaxID=2715425 RepID=UPI001D0B6690|nr:glutamate-cysteine ligase family protein [Microvirga rosea]MCB8822140.1 hypothetical protein [Microvirga rosea]
MDKAARSLDAFSAYGVEIEYCVVDQKTLGCRPIVGQILRAADGGQVNALNRDPFGWSNEFMAHVLEIKLLHPSADLDGISEGFQREVKAANEALRLQGARLMPSAMHPWMDPARDTHVWSNDPEGIYAAFKNIFETGTHGWANVQSMHVNLPFSGEEQFVRLHEIIRLILPIIPALAASSPIADGRKTGFADFRMEAYRTNAACFPIITGQVIPESASSRAHYEQAVLTPMYRAIAEHDRAGALQDEWLNARGAIPRFRRGSIEIRVIDTQECPGADISVAAAIIAVVKMLYEQGNLHKQISPALSTGHLVRIFNACIRTADEALIDNPAYLASLGFTTSICTARDLWRRLVTNAEAKGFLMTGWMPVLDTILESGPLARRIEKAVDGDYRLPRLQEVYDGLCDCLEEGRMFLP